VKSDKNMVKTILKTDATENKQNYDLDGKFDALRQSFMNLKDSIEFTKIDSYSKLEKLKS